eukprot:2577243-Amphidinium_carterae.1
MCVLKCLNLLNVLGFHYVGTKTTVVTTPPKRIQYLDKGHSVGLVITVLVHPRKLLKGFCVGFLSGFHLVMCPHQNSHVAPVTRKLKTAMSRWVPMSSAPVQNDSAPTHATPGFLCKRAMTLTRGNT